MKLAIKTLLPLAAAAVSALAVTAGPAAAEASCWKVLINDWYDGRIDATYPISCYRDALQHLPTDVDTYSSAADDIRLALAAAIDAKKGGGSYSTGATGSTGSSSAGGGTGKGSGPSSGPGRPKGDGPVSKALRDIGPDSADSVPTPLIVLGSIAGLLLALGAAGLVLRRLQARRMQVARAPATPPREH